MSSVWGTCGSTRRFLTQYSASDLLPILSTTQCIAILHLSELISWLRYSRVQSCTHVCRLYRPSLTSRESNCAVLILPDETSLGYSTLRPTKSARSQHPLEKVHTTDLDYQNMPSASAVPLLHCPYPETASMTRSRSSTASVPRKLPGRYCAGRDRSSRCCIARDSHRCYSPID